MSTLLKFSQVIVDIDINPREIMDEEAIADYAANVDELPRMTVFDVPGVGYVLTRGFHRIQAHKLAGRSEAEFNIKPGSLQDAKRDADTDNLTHGVRMTPQERRGVYERELQRNPQRYDTEIAKICKTSPDRIHSIREQMERSGVLPRSFDLFGEIPGNGAGRKTGLDIDPAEFEREWWKHRYERRKTTLPERMRPCEACGWPLSERAHLLDVAAWGDTPGNPERALCARCHETYDIIVNAREKNHGRARFYLSGFLEIHQASNLPGFDNLLKLAGEMLDIRAKLKAVRERQNGH